MSTNSKEYYQRLLESGYFRKKNRESYQRHRRAHIDASLKRYAVKRWDIKAKRLRTKYETLLHYAETIFPMCAICGESNLVDLCLDHMNGDGKVHRLMLNIKTSGDAFYRYLKAHSYPKEPPLRVLCVPCNTREFFKHHFTSHKKSL